MQHLVIIAILYRLTQEPPDIWHDPNALALIGIGAGILGAIATVGAAIYTVRQGRTKRRIEYLVVSDTPIVTVDSTVSGKVQVLFNGQPAEKTRVLVLTVHNAGNSSIHKEDYFEPLSFEFDTEVISADVLSTEPPTLLKSHERKNFLILDKQSVQFPSFPLNRHDALTVTILLKDKSLVRVSGRLDQGAITPPNPRKEMQAVIGAFAAVLLFLLIILLLVGLLAGIGLAVTSLFLLPIAISIAVLLVPLISKLRAKFQA